MLRFEISSNFKVRSESAAVANPSRTSRQLDGVTVQPGRLPHRALIALALAAGPALIAWRNASPAHAPEGDIAVALLKAPAALSRAALRADPRVARDGVDYMATGATRATPQPVDCADAFSDACAPPRRATSADRIMSKVKSALRATAR